MKFSAYRTGRPGDIVGARIEGYRHESGMRLYFSARNFDGTPLTNPGGYDAILKFSDEEDGPAFLEFHSLSTDPVTLEDVADARWLYDLEKTDLAKLTEGSDVHFELSVSDGIEEIPQDKGRMRVLPKSDTKTPITNDVATIEGAIATIGGENTSIGAV